MELKVTEITMPEKIDFNYEELKAEITEKVSYYASIAYTEEMIQEAKKDKAELNKLKKALNDERIRRKKEYLKPFEIFEAKVKELTGIIDEPIGIIDTQVKEYELRIKEEKREAIREYYNSTEHPEELTLEQIFDEKWLNATVSMKKISEAIDSSITEYSSDMLTLAGLPEFSFEAQEIYKQTLDLKYALNEAHRLSDLAKAKAKAEERKRIANMVSKEETEAIFFDGMEKEEQKEEREELPLTDDGLPDFDSLAKKKWYELKLELDRAQTEELRLFLVDRKIKFVITAEGEV